MAASSGSTVKNVLLIGGALYIYSLIKKTTAARTLVFLPGPVKGLYFDSFTPYITVGIIVQNTSNQNYTIQSLAGNVYAMANGEKWNIGNLSTFAPQQIFGNSQQTIFIDLRLSLIGIVGDILNLIDNGIEQEITFEGYANVDGIQVPLDFKYKI